MSPSSQAMAPLAAAKARFESRKFLRGWGSSAVHATEDNTKKQEQLSVIARGLLEPMESVRHIEQQFYCPGLVLPETPIPVPMAALTKRRMTLATDTPGLEHRSFFF
jgi:hypothetical protein